MISDHLQKWRRFSLRTLFIFMTLCCIMFGIWSVYVNPYRLQQRSLAVVNNLQGKAIGVPAEGPGWERWLVTTLLGEQAFQQVAEVDLNGMKVDDEALRALSGLIYLRKLSLDYTAVTDVGLTTLGSMPKLQNVSLRYTNVSDRGAAYLASLPGLRSMHLTGTKITDAAVPDLSKLGTVDELYIRWTGITNAGAERLAVALPQCAVHHHALVAP